MLAVLVLLAQSLSVDIHAHPSRVHRANVSRIEAEEIARYRRSGIDVVHRGVRRRGALRRDCRGAPRERVFARRHREGHGREFRPGLEGGHTMRTMNRREFVRATATGGLAAAAAPTMIAPQSIRPVVVSDRSGIAFKNGGPKGCVETAFERMVQGNDVLDALIEGVNIVENDPEEPGVGYGAVPNADGVVQLDSSCMHGPTKRAGGVAAIEGVRTPSLVAKAVMDFTDHHLLVGKGAQDFARNMGFLIEEDITTGKSRKLWLEWKRRIDPEHYLDPKKRTTAGYEAALQMLREGLVHESHFWGTIHCNGINPRGEISGVTSTSGLSFKIPGRTGDSPILGAGIYVDNEVGACGSTAGACRISTFASSP